MTCPKCGKEVENGAKFCPHCGTLMGEARPSAPDGHSPVSWEEPGRSGRRRNIGLLIGGAAAVVILVVAALAAAAVGGLFASPKEQVEKAFAKTASAYAEARDKAGLPDLSELVRGGAYSQRFSLELDGISQELTDGYDLSALSGLGVRMDGGYSQKERKMAGELAAFWKDEELLSVQMLVDGGTTSFASPQLTGGSAYGVNTETLGADLVRLGADDSSGELEKIGFNLFDLIERAMPSEQKAEEMKEAVRQAGEQLFDAMEVEKGGKETIEVNGGEVDAVVYHVAVPKDAVLDYFDAVNEARKLADPMETARNILLAMGFDEDDVNEILSGLDGEADPYAELFDALKQVMDKLGDLELDVWLSGGRVSAAEYAADVEGSRVELGLYLGGGSSYVDDLSLELRVDGEELVMESSGDHAGKSGVFTDETTLRSDSGRITSQLRYEPKADGSNLKWELGMDSTAALTAEGRLDAGKDSVELRLDRLSVEAAGAELVTLKGSYYLGPWEGVKVSLPAPALLGGMTQEELMEAAQDMEANAESWAYDLQTRILPALMG